MPRNFRVVVEGHPHHIVQRGNNRRAIYDTENDRIFRLQLIEEFSEKYKLTIWGYCLMTNHDHFLAVPQHPDSISSTFRMVNAAYARYFNARLQSCGHVWQDRPYSNPVDADLCWPVLAYIERNPVRAGMVDVASDYQWSSAQFRQLDRSAPKWLDLEKWQRQFTPQRWEDVLRTSLDEEAMQQRVREALRSGRPMGCEEFVEEIEAKTGRILRIQKPGPRAKSIANGR